LGPDDRADTDLAGPLARATELMVTVDNDVNAMAAN
jgi:predicted NBD/HSP70 family sugar kinase